MTDCRPEFATNDDDRENELAPATEPDSHVVCRVGFTPPDSSAALLR
jgi:hypothetical protein